jgi:Uma2 family endonuclease
MIRMIVLDPDDFKEMLRRRRWSRGDRHDEVWNGVYVVSTVADIEHQRVRGELLFSMHNAVADDRVKLLFGANISDRAEHWKRNYRCPDVIAFLPGNRAEDRATHYYGGPDFVGEIITPRDLSRKKFRFYARVGVRELLLVDRNPWALELYRLEGGKYALVGKSEAERPETLPSGVLPVTFRLVPGETRPQIEVSRASDGATWRA